MVLIKLLSIINNENENDENDENLFRPFIIHPLSNILRSKGNQTMIFCRLIEYNKINVSLQR